MEYIYVCIITFFNKLGFGNNFSDWTSLDPAIVSFRQFSQFNPQPPPPPQQAPPQQQQQQQQNQNDMFMSQMTQQGKTSKNRIDLNFCILI